jgi:hypothetical protein
MSVKHIACLQRDALWPAQCLSLFLYAGVQRGSVSKLCSVVHRTRLKHCSVASARAAALHVRHAVLHFRD